MLMGFPFPRIIFAAVFLASLAGARDDAPDSGGVILATRGKPASRTIVIPEDASPSQKHAAVELQVHVARMTGVELPVVSDAGPLPEQAILLGRTRHTTALLGEGEEPDALGDDGFRLAVRPPHLLVIGGSVRGTLYGVYHLLEHHGGCRWFASWHGVIPRLDTFSVPPVDETHRPAFLLREPFWYDMFDGDFAARNRVNGNAARLLAKHGGKIRFGAGLFVHTFHQLCPPEEFFDDHPEYFSEVDGRRVKDPTQLCLTNPVVEEIVTERLLDRIRSDPDAAIYSLSQNDCHNFCTCEGCRKIAESEGSQAGPLIAFVNRVAARVEEEFPDVWIETLAYQSTRKPPRTIRPRTNVAPRICSIECDFSRPLSDEGSPENRAFAEDLAGWGAISDHLLVWDYAVNFPYYLSPFPNVGVLGENARLFRRHGAVGVLAQGIYQGRHSDFAELKAWLLAKWLWDPDLPAEPLLEDFFSGYYGEAAGVIRAYFDELHALHPDAGKPLTIFDPPGRPPFTEDFTARAVRTWREAENLVREDPVRLHNVRMGALPSLYARLAWLDRRVGRKKVWLTRSPEWMAIWRERRALAAELLARRAEGGEIQVSELPGPDEAIIAGWRSLVESGPSWSDFRRAQAEVEDSLLVLSGSGGGEERVTDELAHDRSAIRLFGPQERQGALLPFEIIAFDPGVEMQLRVRVRWVGDEPGESPAELPAFEAGIFDKETREALLAVACDPGEMPEGYRWIEVGRWRPEPSHYFWFAPGGGDGEVLVDKVEVSVFSGSVISNHDH